MVGKSVFQSEVLPLERKKKHVWVDNGRNGKDARTLSGKYLDRTHTSNNNDNINLSYMRHEKNDFANMSLV